MKSKIGKILFILVLPVLLGSCTKYMSTATFPAADEVFITTGDGNIQKPYTPVGQLIYYHQGFRIPILLLGYIPIADIDPDMELKTEIYRQVRGMGGDALINMSISFIPPKSGFLGFGATGGRITVYGTVIKR